MKYGAVRTECAQQHIHASQMEAGRCDDLHVQQRLGTIRGLTQQPVMPFTLNGEVVFKYVADFSYLVGNCEIIEDVKGVRTSTYRLKKKLIERQHNCVITEWPVKIRKKRKAKK